jgi:hypothetical protein
VKHPKKAPLRSRDRNAARGVAEEAMTIKGIAANLESLIANARHEGASPT